MAGILNPKTRFLDSFLTQVGRDQLAHGELRFSFAVFSDQSTYYESDQENPNVISDASNRIFFEPMNRPQDQVIPEFDDDGYISFPAGDFDIVGGNLLQVSGSTGKSLSGDSLIKSSSLAISDCATSFSDLDPLRSEEVLTKTTGFELSVDSHTFICTQNFPIKEAESQTKQLSNAESLWQDKKLTHVPNFQYLPPVQNGTSVVLREYAKLEQPAPLNFDDLQIELNAVQSMRNTSAGAALEATFTKTSKDNNIVCQIFEVTSGSMNKLRMIDFGEFEDSDPTSPGKHVFFAGKLFQDDLGQDTFINLFTVVFD